MKAYSIDYVIKGTWNSILIDAKDVQSAKRKIARKHNCKRIKVTKVTVVGYY